jgi:large subunit ribosomal protein L17
MRHRVAARKLNRTTSHRLAMLGNMVASLLEHEAIRTTVPKAKEARRMAERIITLGKRGGLSNIRLASRTVHSRSLLQKVFGDLTERYADRAGGYTRIVRLGHRQGDAAEMALLELVDRPPAEEQAEKKAKAEEAEKKPAPKKAKPEVAEPEKPAAKKAKSEAAEDEKPPAKSAKSPSAEKSAEAKAKPKKASAAGAGKKAKKKSEE